MCQQLEQYLLQEINWRTNEISSLKSLPFQYNFSDFQKNILRRNSIPLFYSLWEGFVREGCALYIREINRLKLTPSQIHRSLLAHYVSSGMRNAPHENNFDRFIEFTEDLYKRLHDVVDIPAQISMESNVNYKVINKILTRLNLEALSNEHEKKLDKLLRIRNQIAHGDFSYQTKQADIDECSHCVISAMHDLALIIIDGWKKRRFLSH